MVKKEEGFVPIKDLYGRMPKPGEVWEHVESGRAYRVEGYSYNSITDAIEVVYTPLYMSEFDRFNRQLIGHKKAWLGYNDAGVARFVKVDHADPKLDLEH